MYPKIRVWEVFHYVPSDGGRSKVVTLTNGFSMHQKNTEFYILMLCKDGLSFSFPLKKKN